MASPKENGRVKMKQKKKRRHIKYSAPVVMTRLSFYVTPLSPIMIISIICGCLSYFCSILIPIIGGYTMTEIFYGNEEIDRIITIIAILAVSYGILKYIEQYCNQYVSLKLLENFRDKVFKALRRLAPAKTDEKESGKLLSLLSSDIELLEIFYSKTITPLFVAIISSITIVVVIFQYNIILGALAILAHMTIGYLIPRSAYKKGQKNSQNNRVTTDELNSVLLSSIYGIDEILQYNYSDTMRSKIDDATFEVEFTNHVMKRHTASTRSITSLYVLLFSIVMLFGSSTLFTMGIYSVEAVVIPVLLLISSFNAVVSLANLGTGLSQSIASARRIFELIDEKPLVAKVTGQNTIKNKNASFNNASFSYDDEEILSNFSLYINNNEILGIKGKSGVGKSTILKLLMRFRDVDSGEIKISSHNIKNINTRSLRKSQGLVMQETFFFNDTILNNIKIADLDATEEQIIAACKKASIHNFIDSLPNGYDTLVSEMGKNLSDGEKQRIGLARVFLQGSSFILLDEPTSNLDSLNENTILYSLKQIKNKTIIIVSHRTSAMKIADNIIEIRSKRKS